MQKILEQVAWFRAEEYIARYHPYRIVIMGSFGRHLVRDAAKATLFSDHHVRAGYAVHRPIDIPYSILGLEHQKGSMSMLRFLSGVKIREMVEYEPDTIITEVPLFRPGFAPKVIRRLVPQLIVVSAIGSERLDLFATPDMIAHEYLAAIESLPKDAFVVLNADDPLIRSIAPHISHPVIGYGIHEDADVRLVHASRREKNSGVDIQISLHGNHFEIHAPHMFAKQHVSALLAGIATAHAYGVHPTRAIHGIRGMNITTGSLRSISGKHGSLIIDDTNDAVPEQIVSSLQSFSKLPASGKKIVVVGDIEGLAASSMHWHQQIGKSAAKVSKLLICIGDAMRYAQKAVLEQRDPSIDTHHFETSADAALWLSDNIGTGDVVYVAGGAETKIETVIHTLQQ